MVQRIVEFDIWRPGYGGAVVSIYVAGTSTLADVYTDEALTVEADNPQTLSSKSAPDGTNYGKFAAPLYTASSYYLDVDGIENTGIIRAPLASLDGEDASASTVRATGASYDLTLAKFAKQVVYAAAFGVLVEGAGGVAATNNATIVLAIAALSSGGEVVLPAGTYKCTSFNVPEGVVIRGQGRESTVLESIVGDVSFTLTGSRAGFRDITLDGSVLTTGSIAVKSVGKNEIVFQNVMIRRFETGLYALGGKGHVWVDFSIENTENGAKLHGDTDAGDTTLGDLFEDLTWVGGLISVATTIGLSLSYEDAVCHNINLIGVGFESCTGIAFDINGAQSVQLNGCWFKSNTDNVNIADDDDTLTPATQADNDVVNVLFLGGRISGGTFEVTDTCQNVVLQSMKIEDVDFTLTTPLEHFLILRDCYEDNDVTIAGETKKLLRETTSDSGRTFGITTDDTVTTAWAMTLKPGQNVYLEAKVVARGRNVVQNAMYHVVCGAVRPGSTLEYDEQTANFNLGSIVTGATSGATARIQADSDSGTTGTLTLIDVVGEFENNEIITDDGGTPGSATVNGTLTHQDVALDTVSNESVRTAYETNADWAALFVISGASDIEFRITGDTSQTVEWNVHVDVVSN